jgi:hypothetical protein
MGYGSWSSTDWTSYASTTKTKSVDSIYTSRTIHTDLDPKGITFRESCDSDDHPLSTPLILGLDVTGSMGSVLEIAAKKFGTLMEEILDRKPITDPQILSLGIGDVEMGDRYPLQPTQFEVDMKCVDQLNKIYFERGGGGNSSESYHLAWYFAAMKTRCDSMIKRNKKGYLFTVGDEEPPSTLTASQLTRVFGEGESDLSIRDVLTMAERSWHVFHVIVKQGSHVRYRGIDAVMRPWQELLGQRAIQLDDINDLPEVIVSAIQINEGADKDAVVKSWSGNTSLVVSNAIGGLTAAEDVSSELVRL